MGCFQSHSLLNSCRVSSMEPELVKIITSQGRVSKAQGFSDFLQTQRVFCQICSCVFLSHFFDVLILFFSNFILGNADPSHDQWLLLTVLVCALYSVYSHLATSDLIPIVMTRERRRLWYNKMTYSFKVHIKGYLGMQMKVHLKRKKVMEEASTYPGYKSMSVWNQNNLQFHVHGVNFIKF